MTAILADYPMEVAPSVLSSSRRYNGFVAVEVVLRDFDGSKTIFPTELPLKDIIATAETDLEIIEGKIYVKTDEKDDRGRVVYAEQP
jgi:hypothetical protein